MIYRAELAAAILRELDFDYARICAGNSPPLPMNGRRIARPSAIDVTIQIGGRKIRGRAESLDDDGALLLRTEHGRLERITGGDVTLEK